MKPLNTHRKPNQTMLRQLRSIRNSSSAARPASIADRKRLVIVGGVAGGATAAARASRLDGQKLDITIVERSPDVSFANCGLPYFIGGEIKDRSRLALQTPESLSTSLGVRVLTNTEALKIDRAGKTVSIRNAQGVTSQLPYDALILSPGASPLRPPVPGVNDPRVLSLRNLQDMDAIVAAVAQPHVKRVAVVGAGFIGLEMVEQLHRLGKQVSLIEKAPAVLPQADVDMAEFLHAPLVEKGVQLVLGDGLARFNTAAASTAQGLKVCLESGRAVDADLVVLCIGVRPESGLAKDSQLALNPRGYITVNDHMQTSDPCVYAVGDVIETRDLVFPERRATVALGNNANMQARIAADHIVRGQSLPFKGALGTSIVRVFDTVLALTGWTERRLSAAGVAYSSATITENNHAGYYPGATPITLKVVFDPASGRVFGAQAVGVDGVDKRIDAMAMAITGGLTVDDLSLAQLCYSPPFGSARDVVNVAGLAARNIKEGLVRPAYSLQAPSVTGAAKVQLLDVRPANLAAARPVPGAVNIPNRELRQRAAELDPSVEYRTVCNLGKTSYFASRTLTQSGLLASSLVGGLQLHMKPTPSPPPPVATSSGPAATASSSGAPVLLDCTGMACPGPLMKLKDSLAQLAPGTSLHVMATDPGFKADVVAFAASNNCSVSGLRSEKGVVHVDLVKSPAAGAGAITTSTSATAPAARKGATIVVFSQDYDKVLGAFVIANGAAAMGGEVTMFFTFWGLNVLRDPTHIAVEAKPLMDRMFGAMMPKGVPRLGLSQMNFLGAGPAMLRGQMAAKGLPSLPGLMEDARRQGVRMVACTMSMEAMGIGAKELVAGVELGGVAEYLGRAEKAGTNLFI